MIFREPVHTHEIQFSCLIMLIYNYKAGSLITRWNKALCRWHEVLVKEGWRTLWYRVRMLDGLIYSRRVKRHGSKKRHREKVAMALEEEPCTIETDRHHVQPTDHSVVYLIILVKWGWKYRRSNLLFLTKSLSKNINYRYWYSVFTLFSTMMLLES